MPLDYYFNNKIISNNDGGKIEIKFNSFITFNGLFRNFLTDVFEENNEVDNDESLLIKAVQYRCNMNIIECLITIMKNLKSNDNEFFQWFQVK